MAIEQLNIGAKQDSQAKLQQTANVPAAEKIMSAEFNQVVNKVNEVVEAANQKETALSNSNIKFPTSAAVKAETDKKIEKVEKAELEVGSAVDVNDFDPQNKGVLGFKNPIKISGIKSMGLYDGKEIYLFNRSIGILTILHQSALSAPGNRIKIRGNQDLELPATAIIKLRYSTVMACFELVDITGAEIMTHLAYLGNEQRVLTITPQGVVFAEQIIDFQVFDDNANGYANLNALVAAYPTSAGRKKGFQVICPQMNPPTLYIKCGDNDDNWIKFTGSKVV